MREYAGSELGAKSEIKERRIVEAANRKLEQDALRAEASRLRFKKKRHKQMQKVGAQEFERLLAKERSDAKMTKTDSVRRSSLSLCSLSAHVLLTFARPSARTSRS